MITFLYILSLVLILLLLLYICSKQQVKELRFVFESAPRFFVIQRSNRLSSDLKKTSRFKYITILKSDMLSAECDPSRKLLGVFHFLQRTLVPRGSYSLGRIRTCISLRFIQLSYKTNQAKVSRQKISAHNILSSDQKRYDPEVDSNHIPRITFRRYSCSSL